MVVCGGECLFMHFAQKKMHRNKSLMNLYFGIHFLIYPSATCFPLLKNKTMRFISRENKRIRVVYLFTLDWAHQDDSILDLSLSEDVSQHKCGHVIAMDNGNFAIQTQQSFAFI
jgi:hypothetical protein